jgi:hypothetical protein
VLSELDISVFVLNKNAIFQVLNIAYVVCYMSLYLRDLQQLLALLVSIPPSFNLGLEN